MKELIHYVDEYYKEHNLDEITIDYNDPYYKKYNFNEKLIDYLNKCNRKGIVYSSKQNDFAEEMCAYYWDEIPENILNTFINEGHVDYIHENLSTHNAPLLQKKLLKFFGDSINRFFNYDGTIEIYSFHIILNKGVDIDIFKKNKQLLKLLEFFNYKLRETNNVDGENTLFIEPIYSENVDDWVYKNCKGICYHFTTKEHAIDILKTGFRLHNNTTKNIPERIYMYATDKLSIKSGDEYINQFIDKVVDWADIEKNDLAVLRIDLNRTKGYITFYKDTAMPEPEAVFTYNNIPAKCIKEVNYKQIKPLKNNK